MAYREAKTDEEKKRGKSTDELSFEEALAFFKKRGKEKGSSKFRWRGEAYNLDGEKVGGSKKSKETVSTKSSAPESSSRPKQRQQGRGEPNYGESADKPTNTPMGGPRRGRKPTPTRDRREDTTLLRSPDRQPKSIAQGVTAKRKRAQEVLSERAASETATKAKQDSAPSFADYMNEKRRENPDAFRTDPSGFRKKVREMYDTTYGFNKGGMVRQGKTDYKGKGMFYKSASPRGYK
jgi:hypothetical protein